MLFHQRQAFLIIRWLPDIAPSLVERPSEGPAVETNRGITIAQVSPRAFCCPLQELLGAFSSSCIEVKTLLSSRIT